MVRTKVFVGNLSFSTKEAELAKHFEVAGKVISTNIITRGPRSLGYGFVEMENEADAENAVKQLDKKEIDGRPINVEVAKPREENAPNTGAQQGQDQSQNQGQQSQRGGNRGGRGGRRPRGRRPQGGNLGVQGQQGQQQQGQTQQGNQQQQQQNQNQGQQSNRGNRTQGGNRGGNRGGERTERPPRQPRQPRPEGEDTRTPSTTTLFVANLPYALEDEAFAKVLKDSSLAYKSAKVSIKKKSGRSKGFGFIEFENEADQQKALAALHGKKITDRDIVVKVALTGQRDDANKTTTATTPAAAAPADAVTPTNKPSEIKANVAAKQTEKPTTPKQEKK